MLCSGNERMHKVASVLRNLFRREHIERDLDAEVRSYTELLQEEKMSGGMNLSAARRGARMELGGPEQLKEEIRGARAGAWLESFWQDVRFAARMLRKNPGFTAVAVLTLALGIGANTAVFSVVNAVVLRPLPYKDSARLVAVTTNTAMFPTLTLGNSWVAYGQMRKDVSAFEQLTAYRSDSMVLTASGDPSELSVIRTGDGFFDLFGARPQLGRLLVPSDQLENQGHVAVLSDALWRAHFGADSGIVGRTITLNKQEYVVAGVVSRGFAYPNRADLWVPLVLPKDNLQNVASFRNQVICKLRQGSTTAQAQAQLNVVAQDIINANPILKDGFRLHVVSALDRSIGDVRSTYLMLFGAASFVLLIACANLASLLLARGWGRQREMALRTALGATRGRIIRQVLVESCLLGLFGGAAGAALASLGISAFVQIAPASTPRLNEIAVESSMFWFALGSSLIAGILFGLAPALRASRANPNSALKGGNVGGVSGARGARKPGLGNLLVVSEVALAFVLLIGAIITTQGLAKLLKTDTGIRTDHLLTFDLPLSPLAFKNLDALHSKIQDTLGKIRALPGVTDATATDHAVLGGNIYITSGFTVEGVPARSITERSAQVRLVSPSYFRMLGVHLIQGRFFTEHDVSNSEKVAIVNEAMARQLWGTVDAVGKRFNLGNNQGWTTVAGVISDTRDVALGSPPQPQFYFPILQDMPLGLHLILRTAQDPARLAPLVARQVWTVDKDQPVMNVATMDQLISEQVGAPRLDSALLSFFGAIGLGLALLGVYGVVAYSVTRRTKEIGIRMALGADRLKVLSMVIKQGFLLACSGVVIGVAGALALARVLKSTFTVANATDAPTYIVAGLLVIFVACLASFVPARRAMRVDPMVALRHE